MNIDTAWLLDNAAAVLDIDLDIREDYSGRGMYGVTTVAVVLDRASDLAAIAFEAGRATAHDRDEAAEAVHDLRNLRQDSMGHGVVVY